jgi:hypothetical protein
VTRKISIGLLVVCFAVMTAWDVYPALTPELGDTISEAVRDGGAIYYLLPYVCGILMGHFFFNKDDRSSKNLPALWVTCAALAARDLFEVMTFPGGTPLSFILGVLAGYIWWPQGVYNDNPQE